MKIIRLFIAVILLVILGCASTGSIKDTNPQYSRTYDASFNEVWVAVPLALDEERFVVQESDKAKGYIFAVRWPHGLYFGVSATIKISELPNGQVKVEIDSPENIRFSTERFWAQFRCMEDDERKGFLDRLESKLKK